MTHGEGGGRRGGRCARDTNEEGEVVKRFKVRVSECAEVLVGQQEEAVEEEEAHSRLAEGMGSRSRAGGGRRRSRPHALALSWPPCREPILPHLADVRPRLPRYRRGAAAPLPSSATSEAEWAQTLESGGGGGGRPWRI